MAVLVTGGAGYIGSHMVLALQDAGREETVVLDDLSTGFDWALPPEVKLVRGDVGDPGLVTETILQNRVDAIAHFAARIVVPDSVADPLHYYLANTVKTRALIETYAADCAVTLVGSQDLAGLAEAAMKGEPVSDGDIAREIAPCFVREGDARTDCIVLACTHYPLLRGRFEALAPWPVSWIDPAPAIAKRLDHIVTERGFARGAASIVGQSHRAFFSSGVTPNEALAAALHRRGLEPTWDEPLPVTASGSWE